jgi:hypothetical protein
VADKKNKELGPLFRVLNNKGAMTTALPFRYQASKPIRLQNRLPMNFLTRTSSSHLPSGADGPDSRVVPVHDVQWGRPVFRPPELPVHPRLFNTVPFTAMRPLQPTRRGRLELAY